MATKDEARRARNSLRRRIRDADGFEYLEVRADATGGGWHVYVALNGWQAPRLEPHHRGVPVVVRWRDQFAPSTPAPPRRRTSSYS